MSTVSRRITFAHTDDGATGKATLIYNTDRPFDVCLDFGKRRTGEPNVWEFARDLLADGLTRVAGLADVCCWTDGRWYYIALSSSEGRATLRIDADEVRAFLLDAEELVPYGAEVIDFDAELHRLLKTGGKL